jgi:hypothetical protein
LYRKFSDSIGIDPGNIFSIGEIPFLPIQFFKTHPVTTTEFEPEIVFESSGTSRTQKSKHFVKSINLYRKSFTRAFELFYGREADWCILGLLPSYLEREDSSLVMMVNHLIKNSGHPLSNFYLDDVEKLYHTLLHNEILQQPTLLIGVTYALLDFAERYKMKLTSTTIMETGGMKGRREEITRPQVHDILQKNLGVKTVHSEYGMTELLSQAYSRGNGLFKCAPWMKVLIRDEDEPLHVTHVLKNKAPKTGVINVIDLANIFSCAFIATDDLGKLHSNDCFEVLGRCDTSDIRGCSLLSLDHH